MLINNLFRSTGIKALGESIEARAWNKTIGLCKREFDSVTFDLRDFLRRRGEEEYEKIWVRKRERETQKNGRGITPRETREELPRSH